MGPERARLVAWTIALAPLACTPPASGPTYPSVLRMRAVGGGRGGAAEELLLCDGSFDDMRGRVALFDPSGGRPSFELFGAGAGEHFGVRFQTEVVGVSGADRCFAVSDLAGRISVYSIEDDGPVERLILPAPEEGADGPFRIGDTEGEGELSVFRLRDADHGRCELTKASLDGTVTWSLSIRGALLSTDIEMGDLDGDGVMELYAVGTYGGTSELLVYTGGGLRRTVELPCASLGELTSIRLLHHDFDGDSRPDLLLDGVQSLAIASSADGEILESFFDENAYGWSSVVDVDDLTGDGVPDLFAVDHWTIGCWPKIHLFSGSSLEPVESSEELSGFLAVRLAVLDRDASPDRIAALPVPLYDPAFLRIVPASELTSAEWEP